MIEKINIREHNLPFLTEADNKDLALKSRQNSNRWNKRVKYQIPNFKGVDLKQMFENDYFVYTVPINDYAVTVAFPGPLTSLREVCKSDKSKNINVQLVMRALNSAYDKSNDVKVNCTCADWQYRFAYWATKHGYKYGEPQNEPADETNPDDNLGATCKHLDLLLSKRNWLSKSSQQITEFIRANMDKAQKYLYDEEIPEPEEEIEVEEPIEETEVEDTEDEIVDNDEEFDVQEPTADETEEGDL